MKIQNPLKLIIKFIGGGVIKFPTKHLRWIDVEPINSSNNEGTGLTGNLLDDWVNAVTQGEYTKYEDVPIANEEGLLMGWRRSSVSYDLAPRIPLTARSTFFSRDIIDEIIKDGTFKKTEPLIN